MTRWRIINTNGSKNSAYVKSGMRHHFRYEILFFVKARVYTMLHYRSSHSCARLLLARQNNGLNKTLSHAESFKTRFTPVAHDKVTPCCKHLVVHLFFFHLFVDSYMKWVFLRKRNSPILSQLDLVQTIHPIYFSTSIRIYSQFSLTCCLCTSE